MLSRVSVIVAAKNEEKVIENSIKSLLKANYPKDRIEIIISTDKNNTDKTVEICKKYAPKIKVIITKLTHCKAEAVNAVLPKVKGDIVAIFDADSVVEKNCIINAVKNFSDEKVIGVMGSVRFYNPDQNIVTKLLTVETNLTQFQEYAFSKFGLNVNFLGRNMYIRKDILRKIGGFDEYSFLEDIELSTRMRRKNYKVVLENNAIIHEECPDSIKDILKQKLRFFRGIIRIRRKMPKTSLKNILVDILHGFYFYLNSLSSLMFLVLILNLLFFKLSSIILFLSLFLITFQFLVVLASNMFFKQARKTIIFPLYFLLSNLNFYSFLKAWYMERKKEPIKWYRVNRIGYKR